MFKFDANIRFLATFDMASFSRLLLMFTLSTDMINVYVITIVKVHKHYTMILILLYL